ncbi:hypothetical protein [Leucobacter musarum]|uniref:hypothetical protein n=1 Tax=Leucobacter musarum TaxID=1930747 RepID=UPI0006A76463|nr:hypothetical protein [Leucobacter musarum]
MHSAFVDENVGHSAGATAPDHADLRALRRSLKTASHVMRESRRLTLGEAGLTLDEWRFLRRLDRKNANGSEQAPQNESVQNDADQRDAVPGTEDRRPAHPRGMGRRGHGPRRHFAVRRLVEIGWVTRSESGLTLTEAGRAGVERTRAALQRADARLSEAIGDAGVSTAVRTLDAVAQQLGWEPGTRPPRSLRMPHGMRRHRRFARSGQTCDERDDRHDSRQEGAHDHDFEHDMHSGRPHPHPHHRHPRGGWERGSWAARGR